MVEIAAAVSEGVHLGALREVNGLLVLENAEGAALKERVRRGAEAAEVGNLDRVDWAYVLGRCPCAGRCALATGGGGPLVRLEAESSCACARGRVCLRTCVK